MKKKSMVIEFKDEPVGRCRRGRTMRFPFAKLAIGGCFVVKGMTRNTISPYRVYAEKNLGLKFKTEKRKDGIYVWRVE